MDLAGEYRLTAVMPGRRQGRQFSPFRVAAGAVTEVHLEWKPRR